MSLAFDRCPVPIAGWILGMALSLAAMGCAPPPRAVEREPASAPDSATESPAEESEGRTPYDLESEGVFPPPSNDVRFEEDALPAPESVEGQSLDDAPIAAEDLETLPELVGEEKIPSPGEPNQPLPPAVSTPVAKETSLPIPGERPGRGSRGFRVQLAAVADQVEANKLAREAENRLGVAVYVVLEGELYKVRAGDFGDRGEAILLRDRARGNGYAEAWVTPTQIRASNP